MRANEALEILNLEKDKAEALLQNRIKSYLTRSSEDGVEEEMKKAEELLKRKRDELNIRIKNSAIHGLNDVRNFDLHDDPISEFDPIRITVLEKTMERFKSELIKDGYRVKAETYKYHGGKSFKGEEGMRPKTFEWKIGAKINVEW